MGRDGSKWVLVILVLGVGMVAAWPFRRPGAGPDSAVAPRQERIVLRTSLPLQVIPRPSEDVTEPEPIPLPWGNPAMATIGAEGTPDRDPSPPELPADYSNAFVSPKGTRLTSPPVPFSKDRPEEHPAEPITLSVTPASRPPAGRAEDGPGEAGRAEDGPGEAGRAEDGPGEAGRAVRQHTIVEGDTLRRLAQRYLGDEGRYLEIYEANRHVLAHPDVLPLGAVIKISVPHW
jgi:hypothetical protein